MRLTVYTLPKLAVSAKLLCLLMVVICGAVPSMVRSVRLYNDCSGRYVRADMRGRVLAEADESERFQNLTIRSTDFSLKLTIFGEESKRYLCFNKKWKVVGSLLTSLTTAAEAVAAYASLNKNRGTNPCICVSFYWTDTVMSPAQRLTSTLYDSLKIIRSLRDRGPMCQFYEEMGQNGYSRFRSAADKKHFLGFNKRGRPLRGNQLKTPNPKCLNFLKFDAEFSIPDFNAQMAEGGIVNQSLYQGRLPFLNTKRTKPTSEPKSSTQPTHRLRHNRKKLRLLKPKNIP